MKNYYWSLESWGDQDPPENADEIIEWANCVLDEWSKENPEYDDDSKSDISSRLWDRYCQYDEPTREIVDGGLFDQAAELMDDKIREQIHAEITPCSEYIFLLEYMIRHNAKYGEDFVI